MIQQRPQLLNALVSTCSLFLLVVTAGSTQTLEPTRAGTGITYSGQLYEAGAPADGRYDLDFGVYDAAESDILLAVDTHLDVPVRDGRFTVPLDFGPTFDLETDGWLEVRVRPAGAGIFSPLLPRRPLSVVLGACVVSQDLSVSGEIAVFDGVVVTEAGDIGVLVQSAGTNGFQVNNATADGFHVQSAARDGLRVASASENGVLVSSAELDGLRVYSALQNGMRIGFAGDDGIRIEDATTSGLSVEAAGQHGVHIASAAMNGVQVNSATVDGIHIQSADRDGIRVVSAGALAGNFGGSIAVNGVITVSDGLDVQSAVGAGVDILSATSNGIEVTAAGTNGIQVTDAIVDGIQVQSAGRDGIRVSSAGGLAGNFGGNVAVNGDVVISGNLSKGSGSFLIDHPLDPRHRYLAHSFVESPDMMNVYNGNVLLGDDGTAWVELPDYFEALNRDLRYQLTPLDAFAALYVAERVRNNRFLIGGGEPGMTVSWQVTGIRQDPYAEVNRIEVERTKPIDQQGSYLHPQAYEVLPSGPTDPSSQGRTAVGTIAMAPPSADP